MAKSKKKKASKAKINKPADYNAYINLDGEIESILEQLAGVYEETDGDMQSVEQAIKDHLMEVVDDVLSDYNASKLEKNIKKSLK
ncbi:MAG: hypothetical protein WA160_06780 [Pseudobdellovibrio sp.]